MMDRKIIILFIIVAILISGVQEAISRPNFLVDFKNKYPETAGTRIDSCILCHLDNTNTIPTNPYGKTLFDLKSLNFSLIEANDSDNDGYTNIEEIRNLTFPGDPNDKPGSLNPNITSPTAALTKTAVMPAQAATTVEKTPGFEMLMAGFALLAIYTGRKEIDK